MGWLAGESAPGAVDWLAELTENDGGSKIYQLAFKGCFLLFSQERQEGEILRQDILPDPYHAAITSIGDDDLSPPVDRHALRSLEGADDQHAGIRLGVCPRKVSGGIEHFDLVVPCIGYYEPSQVGGGVGGCVEAPSQRALIGEMATIESQHLQAVVAAVHNDHVASQVEC